MPRLGELGGEDDGAHGALLLDHHRAVVPRVPHQLRKHIQGCSASYVRVKLHVSMTRTQRFQCIAPAPEQASGAAQGQREKRLRVTGAYGDVCVQTKATKRCVLAGGCSTNQLVNRPRITRNNAVGWLIMHD